MLPFLLRDYTLLRYNSIEKRKSMRNLEELIHRLHLEDLRNENHPSFFDENEDYDMLIVRLPVLSNEFETSSIGFIFTHEKSFLYDRTEEAFRELETRFEAPYKLLDKMIDRLLKTFVKYQDLTADMEEVLYEGSATDDFMTNWLGLKRDILRIERILLRTSETIKEVIDHYIDVDADTFPTNSYVDLFEHTERIQRSATLQLSKLDYIYSFYNARINEKMNLLVYFLTIISAIFLPLNLVVGFFGMNTSGLPFAQGDYGTLSAITLMLSLVIITTFTVYIWRRKVEK